MESLKVVLGLAPKIIIARKDWARLLQEKQSFECWQEDQGTY